MAASGAGRTKFVADAMLGSLARKLRALGFDTSYFRAGDDSELLGLAREQGRIILTADQSLASLAGGRGLRVILVAGRSDSLRLKSIADSARALGVPLARGSPLCSVCGGALETLERRNVAGRVPPQVERSHRQFYECAWCGKLYWKGGHWKGLRSLAQHLGTS